MKRKLRLATILICVSIPYLINVETANSAVIKTAFATIFYENSEALTNFNQKLGCNLPERLCLDNQALPEASAAIVISTIVEQVQKILDMHPQELQFHIHVLSSPEEVQYIHQSIYGIKVDFIAFYSPQNETIYLATNSLKRSVLSHEIVHAVVDRYFDKAPPTKIHELLAQYVEGQL